MTKEVPSSNDGTVCTDETMEVVDDAPKHPYHLKLAEFVPNAWQLEEHEPEKSLSLEETKVTFVDSQELLDEMMVKLKQMKEVGMDLRHSRSFTGVVCLVRISTRTEDFIIDALTLKEELSVLNEICTDGSILKVLHNSYGDILGLQRDFGVYIINMFDVLVAAKALKGYNSLVQMLKEICDVNVERNQQVSNWRSRPLPSEMINHQRENIRYLLYMHDIYRKKLLDASDSTKNLLTEVYKKSTELCSMVYVKPVFTADSYKDDYKKVKGTLAPQQLECFRLLHAWRDKTAREHDESQGYTLPNKMMFEIAKKLPKSPEGIKACCKQVPTLVNQNLTHIQTLVMEAINNIPAEANKNVTEKGKLPVKKSKKKSPFCFKCKKFGHMLRDCTRYDPSRIKNAFVGSLNRGRNDPYVRYPHGGFGRGAYPPRGGFGRDAYPPRGGFGRGAFADPRGGGGFGRGAFADPRGGGFGRGAFAGGYGRGGYQPIPQPHPMGYGGIQPSFNSNMNPWHPYP